MMSADEFQKLARERRKNLEEELFRAQYEIFCEMVNEGVDTWLIHGKIVATEEQVSKMKTIQQDFKWNRGLGSELFDKLDRAVTKNLHEALKMMGWKYEKGYLQFINMPEDFSYENESFFSVKYEDIAAAEEYDPAGPPIQILKAEPVNENHSDEGETEKADEPEEKDELETAEENETEEVAVDEQQVGDSDESEADEESYETAEEESETDDSEEEVESEEDHYSKDAVEEETAEVEEEDEDEEEPAIDLSLTKSRREVKYDEDGDEDLVY